jgi:hypothetical protein
MMSETTVTLVAAVLACIASIANTLFSIYNNRFARERWWDRKSEAYTRIVSALSDLVDYYDQMVRFELGIIAMSDQHRKEITEHWRSARKEVVKASYMGAFIVSAETEVALQRFRQALNATDEIPDIVEAFDQDYGNAKECLKQVIACAKKDLKVR